MTFRREDSRHPAQQVLTDPDRIGHGSERWVTVDDTFIGGDEPGLRGGRAPGKKVLTGIAVEVREPKGRCWPAARLNRCTRS